MLKKGLLTSLIVIIIYLILIVTISKINSFSNSYSFNKSTFSVDSHSIKKENNIISFITSNYVDNSIGNLYIPKIGLDKKIYPYNSKENNIERNVTVLDGTIFPDKESSIVFLAAHSGTGRNAFFKNLKYLEKEDIVYFIYNNKKYVYVIDGKTEVAKNGFITVHKKYNHEIILTTCSDNPDKQLIIHGIRKSN